MELLEWGNAKLKATEQSRLDSPILDAELLLATTLGQPKSYLFANLNFQVSDKVTEQFRKMIKRRAEHEPIAYIIGKKAFYRRDFLVNRFVLCPRPDTETLIEAAIELTASSDDIWFTDIGTGSGAIAVTLAAETKHPVIATDINTQALAVAKQNADKFKVTDRIDFKSGDNLEPVAKLFSKLSPDHFPHELIICANLPYLTEAQWESAQTELKVWEPKEALVAGADGLDEYWKLFRLLAEHQAKLPNRITALIEIDPHQTEAATKLIKHYFPHAETQTKKDLAGLDRVIVAKIK